MTLEEMSNEELLDLFRNVVLNLPGSGARGRAYFYEVQEEVLDRLNQNKKSAK